jgi:hypothetical protein
MTMQPNHHPDEERLAAFAGGEPDVELRVHVRDCTRCSSIIDELAILRAALAELPDLAPSRPLQLLPEVPEPQPSAAERLAGWTRGAFMPLLAAGFGLAIVGSVGTAGSIFSMGASGGAFTPTSGSQFRDLTGASAPADTASAAPSAATDGAAAAPGASKTASEATGRAAESASSSPESERATASGSPEPEPVVKAFEQPPAATPRSLWPMVLFAGVALIVATLLLRWIVQPRAG